MHSRETPTPSHSFHLSPQSPWKSNLNCFPYSSWPLKAKINHEWETLWHFQTPCCHLRHTVRKVLSSSSLKMGQSGLHDIRYFISFHGRSPSPVHTAATLRQGEEIWGPLWQSWAEAAHPCCGCWACPWMQGSSLQSSESQQVVL